MIVHVKTVHPAYRKALRLPPDLWLRVAAYRHAAKHQTENDAFKRLIMAGLEVEVAELERHPERQAIPAPHDPLAGLSPWQVGATQRRFVGEEEA